MNVMIALALAVGGLIVGFLLNPVITRLATHPRGANPLPPARHPLLGGPAWIGVVVAALMALMAVAIYRHYGLTLRALYWFAVAAVLVVTGAVDWKVRLIDVLVLLVATIAVLTAAPFVGIGLKNALLGAVIAGVVFIFFFMLARLMFPGPGVPFGLGDIYLAIFIGAALGLGHLGPALFYGVLMAGIASMVILAQRQMGRQLEPYLSYGTYLCLGTLLYMALWSPL
ncbi:MAG: prepilin peptidase [Herpetosiphonaceae bacterium]|nr:prepilin peptidase [Herpetosiphonaceae bacterium]